jgi:glycosyltransferase involved in cell wall biosynthesis
MYNCAPQIGRVLAQLDADVQSHLSGVLLVDNRSTDMGAAVAEEAIKRLDVPATLVRNDENYGLGGSHKVAFLHALENGYDHLIVLHGDDQGNIADLLPYLNDSSYRDSDALLGARFMAGSRLEGYSTVRTAGNYAFNMLYSAALRRRVHDLGSGLNMYAVSKLRDRWWLKNSDDLTFNYHMLLRSYAHGWKIRYFPVSWREDDQISNVKLFRQATRVASLPFLYASRRQNYLSRNFSGRPTADYTCKVVATNHA